MKKLKVLHIEDEKWFHQLVSGALKSIPDYQVELQWLTTIEEGLSLLKDQSFDLILLDRNLNGSDSFEKLESFIKLAPTSALLVLSSDSDSMAIEQALSLGAHDYLIKTPNVGEELKIRIQVALKSRNSTLKLNEQKSELDEDTQVIGTSDYTKALREKLSQLSQSKINVLITGESGTGKEVIAREIHRLRNDPIRPFVAVNCGAISESVFESELFGHVKGAFTGASQNRPGLLSAANGGDLFLDEVADLPLSQQVKLLRFIQDGTYTPVGSTRENHAEVRIIAATNKNLEEEVRAGRFREDLFYRLDVYRFHTKALRERVDDIEPLADFFVGLHSEGRKKITKEAKKLLEKCYWKGNVRELSCVIQRALVEAMDDDYVRAPHIHSQNLSGVAWSAGDLPLDAREVSHSAFERYVNAAMRTYLETSLELFGNDTDRLSRALHVSRATVYNKINKLKIRMKTP